MTGLLWVGIGALGGLAAVGRFALDEFVSARTSGTFPAGTLLVNLTGALLVGVSAALSLRGSALVLVDIAALGSYTTFSTWIFEAHRLGEDGEIAQAVTSLLLSLVLGLGAVVLGHLIGGAL
ncbi:MAG: fluoride efflux transporter CrcB [Thermoleophilaceae bacterium]|jgi:CrcB protein